MCIHFSSSRGKRESEGIVLGLKLEKGKRVKTMNTKHKLSFYLNDTEYAQLRVRAEACNMSINAYAKQLALNETDCR